MKYKVFFTKNARSDMYEIIDFIAKDSPYNAKKFIEKLENKIFSVLSIFPLSGTKYKGTIRFFPFSNYIVIYEVNEDKKEVYIYVVSEAHQQWKLLLDLRIN